MSKPNFIIVDGYSFIHRSYNALPPLTNSKGFPTHSITGTINMINAIKKKFNPEKLIIAYDHKGKNFRHDMFPDYKANRTPMEDDLRIQIAPIKEIVRAWGLPELCIEGVEADDSMGTLAFRARDAGYNVAISTSDKDMRQLVSNGISILDTKDIANSSEPYGEEGVFERMGVYPNRVIDFLALVGDKVDNVPGVYGCGDKTAIKWLNLYGDVEGIIENADKIGGKIGETLRNSIEMLRLSYKLVVIDTNVQIDNGVDDFVAKMDEDKLLELVNEYELKGFKKSLDLKDKNAIEVKFSFIDDTKMVNDFLISITQNKPRRIYIEAVESKLLISLFKTDDYYLFDPKEHMDVFLNIISNNTCENSYLLCSLDSKAVLKVAYNAIQNNNVFHARVLDLRVYDYVVNGGQSKIKSVSDLNDRYTQFSLSNLRDKYKLDDKTPKWDNMNFDEKVEVKIDELAIAKFVFSKKVEFSSSLVTDLKLLPILTMMEVKGTMINPEILENHGKFLDGKIEDISKDIFEIAGQDFNIASPKQVGHILFDVLEIESKKKTTAEDVLRKIADDNPIVNKILEWRSLSKLKSTYIDGLISRMDKDNLLHTTFNQTITLTGRLSSTDPNLQNIPIRTEDGRVIREAFVARKGYKILAADYSQIELRVLAHMANITNFIEAFQKNIDIHSLTASEVFGVDLEDVTSEQRRNAKAINFGLIYGMGVNKLAEELGISRKESKLYMDTYFEKYDVKPYFEGQLNYAQENLSVQTLSGRKIPTTGIKSTNSFIRSHAELAAKNGSIQGTAADIIKNAMIDILKFIHNDEYKDVSLLMQVHDELVFEVPEDIAHSFAEKVKITMENVVSLSVPLLVEYNLADNWLDAH
jgi:DNA polymerase-1